MAASNALIVSTVEHLSRFAPFGSMSHESLNWMAERLKLAYYAKGETVLSPESGAVSHFFIIKRGEIHGEQDVVRAQDDAAWLELHEGECFPLGALLSRRPVNSTYRAGTDTFCYELATCDFQELLHQCSAFHDFCTRRLANLLEQSKQVIQAQYTKSSSDQQSMTTPLAAIVRREPITCGVETPLRDLLETMNRHGIGAMVAVDAEKRPLGIFTLHDVLSRVTLPNLDLATPFKAVMSPDPITLPPHALAYEAALVMAKQGFRHILVVENEKLIGLLSEKDLFTLQRVGLRQLSGLLRKAADLDTLKHAAGDIRQLAHNMLAQGVTAEQLNQIISTLNDLLTHRLIELALEADASARTVEFCWLAIGSEGRLERTLSTEQDNGLIFSLPDGFDAETIRAVLLPFAKRINEGLAECGFPLGSGDTTASNPKWCLSLPEWKATFKQWIEQDTPDKLLQSSLFFDFRPQFGAVALSENLRHWLNSTIPKNTHFLHQLVVNALRNKPPLGIVRDFVTRDGHTLDLKLNGITPFVDAARIFGLAHAVNATNTLQRLRDVGEKLHLPAQDISAYCDAFLYLQLLRLRLNHAQGESGETLSNKVNPDRLNALDSRILREAFRQARKLQTKLALDYPA